MTMTNHCPFTRVTVMPYNLYGSLTQIQFQLILNIPFFDKNMPGSASHKIM